MHVFPKKNPKLNYIHLKLSFGALIQILQIFFCKISVEFYFDQCILFLET